MSGTAWGQILDKLRGAIDPDEYRRWFSASSQASDSGDQLTIWVPSSTDARHISVSYLDRIYRVLEEMDRINVSIRFVATGYEDDEDEDAG